MAADETFEEIVLFEVPNGEEAQHLWLRLQAARLAWLQRDEDRYWVAAVIRAEAGDLAMLLREVENWVVERSLTSLPFELDGRMYDLQPRRENAVRRRELA
jgi:hypothetical protein